MTVWSPDWRITIHGEIYTALTLSNLVISAGRPDIYSQPNASYASVTIINLNDEPFDFDVTDSITIELKDSSGTYVALFGGTITDLKLSVQAAGSVAVKTAATITAVGALAKLSKALHSHSHAKAFDGDQIYNVLSELLMGTWNDENPSLTWNDLDGENWLNAANLGLGEIDRPGQYEMEAISADSVTVQYLAQLLANSGLGVLFEDGLGRISYADATHRQNYLATNGYQTFDAQKAIAQGIATINRAGTVRNYIEVQYGNNFGSSKTSEDTTSAQLYGKNQEVIKTVIHNDADAQDVADRIVALRGYPRASLQAVTFQLASTAITDSERDTLIGIFMGMPIKLTNLPIDILGGQFEGFVEGWTLQASFNALSLTINASPVEYSTIALRWNQVIDTEEWDTLSGIITWNEAIGVVA